MNDPIALSSPTLSPVSASESGAQKSRWPLYVLGGAALLATVSLGAAMGAYGSWQSSGRIAPRVRVAGVEIGGLTKAEARKQVAAHFGAMPLKLTLGSRQFETNVRELGGAPSLDFAVAKAAKIGRDGSALANFTRVYSPGAADERLMLPVKWNKAALVNRLRAWDKGYAQKPVDARLEVDVSGARTVPERLGRRLNIGASAQAVQSRYFVGTRAIKLYSRPIAAKISAASLQGQDVLLASYPTRFNSGLIGRTANIRVACATIDGHVLMPGESFSFNSMTGERTWKKGYRMAHIFETKPGASEAEVVDGLAGGVCQVSSTLYNAVRRANQKIGERGLKIVERNSHSLPVSYVPSGLDATVAWPSKDFRFRNTLPHPVYLRTAIRRGKLTIGVWGRVPDGAAQFAALPEPLSE